MDDLDLGSPSSGKPAFEFLEAPFRRPKLVLIPWAIVFGLVVATSYLLPKKYKSSSLILVEPDKVPETVLPRKAQVEMGGRAGLSTLGQEILSRTRLERVIREVDPYPTRRGGAAPNPARVAEVMRANITVNVKGADAFMVEFAHTDPKKAMEVTNRLVTLWIEEASQQKEEQAGEAYEFLDAELEEARKALEEKEEAIRQFKAAHIGTLPEQTTANLATLQRLQSELQSLNLNLIGARDRQATLEAAVNEPVPVAPGGAPGQLSTDPAVALRQLEAQLAQLRSRYTEQHPDVKALTSQIERQRKAIADAAAASPSPAASPGDRQVAAAPPGPAGRGGRAGDPGSRGGASTVTTRAAQLESVKQEVRQLELRRTDLEKQIATFQARVELAPKTEAEYGTLSRDYQRLREAYYNLYSRKTDAEMATKLEKRWKGQRFRVLDPANLPTVHYFPNRILFAVGGLFGGLFVGLLLSMGAELLDHSIKSLPELESAMPYPVLGTIPHIDQPKGKAEKAAATA
jgi:polysaccharide chain length determinant protein (PEP-CTERM system associated)